VEFIKYQWVAGFRRRMAQWSKQRRCGRPRARLARLGQARYSSMQIEEGLRDPAEIERGEEISSGRKPTPTEWSEAYIVSYRRGESKLIFVHFAKNAILNRVKARANARSVALSSWGDTGLSTIMAAWRLACRRPSRTPVLLKETVHLG